MSTSVREELPTTEAQCSCGCVTAVAEDEASTATAVTACGCGCATDAGPDCECGCETQPWLPMTQGRAGHDDPQGNGGTTLFAALDVATGAVIGRCLPKHRHEESLTFLKPIDQGAVPLQGPGGG